MRRYGIAIALVCALLCVTFLNADYASAQCEIQSVGLLGSVDLGFMPEDVAVSGSNAYLLSRDTGFTVVDVSDPTAPRVVASIEMTLWSSNIAVAGSYAYVSGGDFTIIDISDPAAPYVASSLSFGLDPAEGVAISGSYAYVACYWAGLKIVDISDPFSPQVLGSVETGSIAMNVDVSGSYAYVAHQGRDVVIVDVSDPAAPAIAGTLDTESAHRNIAVSGSYAYMVSSHNSGVMEVVDISDPSSPRIVGSLDTGGMPENIVISGSYAYAIGAEITVIDISDPTSPYVVNALFPGSFAVAVDLAIAGPLAYVAYRQADSYDAGGLTVIDISHPLQLPIVETLNQPDYVDSNDIVVSGSFAYTAGSSGLQVIDISAPAAPVPAGLLATPQSGAFTGVAVSGPNAVVADYFLGLHVADVSNPSALSILTTVDTPGTPESVAVSGSYAYVADGDSGLQIIDISDPVSANIVGSTDLPGYAGDVAISGSHACVVGRYSPGLQIVDISDPAAPAVVGSTVLLSYVESVAASGSYVYVVDLLEGLKVVDISDPTAPTVVGSCQAPGIDVSLSGSYAYIANNSSWGGLISLFVVDISNPASPLTVASVSTPDISWGHSVAVSGSYAYLDGSDYFGDRLYVIGLCPNSGGSPAIALNETALSASNDQGVTPPDQYFDVWNSGTGTLSYFISMDVSWLNVDPFRGGSLGEHDTIEVSFSTSGLPAGVHTGRIIIADPAAANNPQYIDVTVTIPPVYHTLTTDASPPETGTVTGGGTYESVESALIEAFPNAGWEFDHWESGDDSNVDGSTLNPISILMDADKTVTAVFEAIPLTHIFLLEPANGSVCYSNPTFGWTSGAGTDTAFSVDMSFNYRGPYYSMWKLFRLYSLEENWSMPPNLWRMIPSGSYVYWRVRGIDRDAQSPALVFSNEVWWFYKP